MIKQPMIKTLAVMALLGFAAASFAALPPGTTAPDFSLPTTKDSTISLSQFRGQAVILAFWKSN